MTQPIAQEPELHEWITSKDEKFKREYVLTDEMKFGTPQRERDRADDFSNRPLPVRALRDLVQVCLLRATVKLTCE